LLARAAVSRTMLIIAVAIIIILIVGAIGFLVVASNFDVKHPLHFIMRHLIKLF
jgi:hypothetical protein